MGQALGPSPPFLSSHWSVALAEIVETPLIVLLARTHNASARNSTRITVQYAEVCLQINKL